MKRRQKGHREEANSKNQEDEMLGDSDKESGRQRFSTEFPHTDGQSDGRNENPQETFPAERVTRHPHKPPNTRERGWIPSTTGLHWCHLRAAETGRRPAPLHVRHSQF